MLVHWIWLATRPHINDGEKVKIVQHFLDAEDVYFADAGAYGLVEGLAPEAVASLKDKDLATAEEILQQCTDKQIHLLTYRDAQYPERLKNIADPPLVLYYRGQLPHFDSLPVIGVVGTRDATPYGMSIARRMGAQIARCGGLVVSGLAMGIDGMAMRGALTAGANVVGLMGCGVDVVYPAANRSLLLDCQQHGCLLSEYPPDTPPLRWNFPRRNRIISGLSCGILVVEAPKHSGALITARQAADQGRDVFVVPGNVDVAACTGSNGLLRDGAIAVSTGWDVLSEYVDLFPGKIRQESNASVSAMDHEKKERPHWGNRVAQKGRFPKKSEVTELCSDKKSIDNAASEPYIDLKEISASLTPEEHRILELLGEDDCLVDEIIAGSGLASGAVLSTLTLMEVKGLIARLPGRRVRRSRQKP